MKTIAEIAQEIKTAFMSNELLVSVYDLDSSLSFDEQFPASSIEANIINVVATVAATIIWQYDSYKEDIEALLLKTFPGTVAWYHNLVMSFVYNDVQVISYAAIVEQYPNLLVKVNGEDYTVFEPESGELIALRDYLNENKFAGTHISVVSRAPDEVVPTLKVWLDPAKFDSEGCLLSDGSEPVADAIDAYLANIVYNGTLNKTKLVDAVQLVDGVRDVSLTSLSIDSNGKTIVLGENNFNSYGGAFISNIKNIDYVFG